jgi:hypothetical protein
MWWHIFLSTMSWHSTTNYLDRPSIFVTLFSFLQSCATQDEMNTAFQSVLANMSSIVNVADSNIAYSFECPVTGVKRRNPDDAGLMASTNHFIDPSWGIAPPGPTEDSAVRRNNLLALANANKGYLNVEIMKQILGKSIGEGGATNDGTIFQIIAVPSDLTMWLKAPGNFDWQRVDLDKLFIW